MKLFVLIIALSFAKETTNSPGTLGTYNNFYPKSEWTWYKDSGVELLKHKTIKRCVIAVNLEPWGYEEGGWDFKETEKIFFKTKYRVIRIEYKGKLWCYTYTTEESQVSEHINVYMKDSCKACLKAVEQIILNKEKFIISE